MNHRHALMHETDHRAHKVALQCLKLINSSNDKQTAREIFAFHYLPLRLTLCVTFVSKKRFKNKIIIH